MTSSASYQCFVLILILLLSSAFLSSVCAESQDQQKANEAETPTKSSSIGLLPTDNTTSSSTTTTATSTTTSTTSTTSTTTTPSTSTTSTTSTSTTSTTTPTSSSSSSTSTSSSSSTTTTSTSTSTVATTAKDETGDDGTGQNDYKLDPMYDYNYTESEDPDDESSLDDNNPTPTDSADEAVAGKDKGSSSPAKDESAISGSVNDPVSDLLDPFLSADNTSMYYVLGILFVLFLISVFYFFCCSSAIVQNTCGRACPLLCAKRSARSRSGRRYKYDEMGDGEENNVSSYMDDEEEDEGQGFDLERGYSRGRATNDDL